LERQKNITSRWIVQTLPGYALEETQAEERRGGRIKMEENKKINTQGKINEKYTKVCLHADPDILIFERHFMARQFNCNRTQI
jgi:hypothetical protein